jgi:hypothetical protein
MLIRIVCELLGGVNAPTTSDQQSFWICATGAMQ